ncbi:copper chaperone [Mangrovicoccus ximenensis]|uniref:copper chaperone n=1 Tax=Mangrovicoccus ximenensis TaxID=1911570 RepID=UPI0038B38674
MQHPGRRRDGGLSGPEHGTWGLGRCWMPMAPLFAGSVMPLYGIAGLAAFATLEKRLPCGRDRSKLAGTAPVAWGVSSIAGGPAGGLRQTGGPCRPGCSPSHSRSGGACSRPGPGCRRRATCQSFPPSSRNLRRRDRSEGRAGSFRGLSCSRGMSWGPSNWPNSARFAPRIGPRQRQRGDQRPAGALPDPPRLSSAACSAAAPSSAIRCPGPQSPCDRSPGSIAWRSRPRSGPAEPGPSRSSMRR